MSPSPLTIRELIIAALLIAAAFGTALTGAGSIPPLDRDEPRFAQATQEMMAEGSLLVPTFEEAVRAKKPPGIHWLQMLSVAAVGKADPSPIRPFRLPSALGIAIAVGLTFALGRAMAGPWVGLLAALTLAASPVVLVEGHLATTDAVLLAAVMAAQYFLWTLAAGSDRLWLRIGLGASIGAAALLKGPVGVMFPVLTGLVFALVTWRRRPLAVLVHPWTLAALAVVFLPWPIALLVTDQLHFIIDALREDFLPKLAGGVESHGAPPGTYVLAAVATLGPALVFLPAAMGRAIRERGPLWMFLIAWTVPSWLVLEFVPTKLPHYVMPLYPALAIGVALAAGAGLKAGRWSRRIGWGLGAVCAALFAVVALGLPIWLDLAALPFALIAVALLGGCIYLALRQTEADQQLVRLSIGSLAFFAVLFFLVLPNLSPFALSARLAEHGRAAGGPEHLYVVGYGEPSLTFLLGRAPVRGDAAGAAAFLAADPAARAVLRDRDMTAFLDQAGGEAPADLCTLARIDGFNLGKGRRDTYVVIGRGTAEQDGCVPLRP